MPRGTIKFFNESRGYGFITPAGVESISPGDVYVHHSQISDNGFRTFREGQEVEFDVKESVNGTEAINVHRAR